MTEGAFAGSPVRRFVGAGTVGYALDWARDFDRECTMYGCTIIASPPSAQTVSANASVDARTFLAVMAPADTASHYTIFSVLARNPPTGSFSAKSNDVRVARNGALQ